jgi:FkbM family methyltransferase
MGRLLRFLGRRLASRMGPRYRRTAIGIQLRSRERPLHLVSHERLLFYPRGVNARFAEIASEYGIPEHVTLGAGDVVLDIGANIGEFAIVCSRVGATVYAMEPDIHAFLCLARNVDGLDVVPLNVAAWNVDSMERLNIATSSADSSLVNRSPETRQVLALRLDTFARLCGLKRVKLIKCDAEGGEPEVLAGAQDLLSITEYISFDCGPERAGNSTVTECTAILEGAGFEVLRSEARGRHNLIARNSRLGVHA